MDRRLTTIICLILGVILTGTIGYHIIERWSIVESFYMTIITISTVGYGEVSKLSTAGRMFTVFLILAGIAVISTGLSLIFSSIMEGSFGEIMRRQNMAKKVAKIKDHFIICGYGVVGEDVINEFVRSRASFLVVDKNREILGKMLKEFPETVFVEGDATDEEVLRSAGIERAKGLIAVLGNDADNLYICLTARSLNPGLRIIARAIESEAINKLKKAGADYVFSPEKIGGLRLAAAALRPSVTFFLDAVLHGDNYGLTMDEVLVESGSAICGKKLRHTKISQDIGIVISAVKSARQDKPIFNPSPDTVIHSGDILIAFGFPEQIKTLKSVCGGEKNKEIKPPRY